MKGLYLFVAAVVLLIFCNYIFAETVEVFLRTPGISGKPEVKIDGISPKLKIEKSLMSLSISTLSVSTLTPNPSITINQKIIAVSSNTCLGVVNENTVVFKCIPQIIGEGEIGKILIQSDGQEISLKYSAGIVIEPDIHSVWSIAPIEILPGQISTLESNDTIWIGNNDGCKIKRDGIGKIRLINRPGDINLDGIVNILDLIGISKQFDPSVSPDVPEDMNWDGKIDEEDLEMAREKFGTKYSNTQLAPSSHNRTLTTWASTK